MVLREGQNKDARSTTKEFSTFYIKATTAHITKGISLVDPYYFCICVSLTLTLHACVHVH